MKTNKVGVHYEDKTVITSVADMSAYDQEF